MQPQWTWVLADNNFTPVGEILNAKNRRITLPLNKVSTASCQIRMDNPLVARLSDGEGYLKVYRDGVLRFYGPIITVEETVVKDSQTLVLNATDPGWIFSKRLAGKSDKGDTPGVNMDRATIFETLLDTANFEWDTGISTDNLTPAPAAFGDFTGQAFFRAATDYSGARRSSGSDITYTAGPYKPLIECLRELSTGRDGFDWRLVPFDNFDASMGEISTDKIAEWQAFPLMGSDRPAAVFEYGTGRLNVQDFKRTIDRQGQATKVYHNAAAGPDAPGYPTVSAVDFEAALNWGILEDVAIGDLELLSFRQRLVDEHIRVRSKPRQIIEFTPHIFVPGRMPSYGIDYEIGDNVRVRIHHTDRMQFDGYIRVWGVSFEIDDAGVERVAITMAEEA
jgi:hypothetical protein